MLLYYPHLLEYLDWLENGQTISMPSEKIAGFRLLEIYLRQPPLSEAWPLLDLFSRDAIVRKMHQLAQTNSSELLPIPSDLTHFLS